MSNGTVKWFSPDKGYGFIQPTGGGKDVFVHVSEVKKAGLDTLREGQSITFDVHERSPGKFNAVKLAEA